MKKFNIQGCEVIVTEEDAIFTIECPSLSISLDCDNLDDGIILINDEIIDRIYDH